MDECGVMADFGANGTTCQWIDPGTTDFDDVLILNRDGEATRIGTIQGTDARGGEPHALFLLHACVDEPSGGALELPTWRSAARRILHHGSGNPVYERIVSGRVAL
jgi:hypothetical protein